MVLENGIKQAAAGKRVSGDIVYLLEQVQTGPPRREAIDLLEELQHNVLHLLRDTEAVSDRLSEVRLALRTVNHRSVGLKSAFLIVLPICDRLRIGERVLAIWLVRIQRWNRGQRRDPQRDGPLLFRLSAKCGSGSGDSRPSR